MTGPFVPVGILNPIRAVVGIPHHRFNLFVKCSRRGELLAWTLDVERRRHAEDQRHRRGTAVLFQGDA